MSMINITNLTFCYEESYDNIFTDVSLRLDTAWKLGFSGRNGRGKTTFFKLLMGEYEYSGSISSDVSFEYFPFKIKNPSELTIEIIENILPDLEYWQLQRELSLLNTDESILYRPFNTLSGGEQVKAMLAALFIKENSFLLIDEPTNHLDTDARQTMADYLNTKSGFILISHDRQLLDSCTDHTLVINKTNIELQKGNFSSWYENKQKQDSFEQSKNEQLKKDILRLQEAEKRTAEWSQKTEKSKKGQKVAGLRPDRGYIGHKAAKMMSRSKAAQTRRSAAIEEKSALLKNIETVEALKINFLKHHSKNPVSFSNVSLFYGNTPVCENLNFNICRGEIYALYGKNGCGKSTVLKFINGDKSINFNGNFKKAADLKISYIPQDFSFLKGDIKKFAGERNIDESLFKAILRKLDFSRLQFEKDMADLSDGQKKKILIAASLSEQAHLYLWDEPLNFIDIFSRIQIEELLKSYAPTMLFVEHDKAFAANAASQIITI